MTENKADEQLGEDPEVLKEQANATQNLADFLKLHNIEVDYHEADWKDGQGLAEGIRDLCLKHPGWSMYYFSGDTWGIDSNFVFFTSRHVESEVVEKIGEFIVEFGADLPEDIIPPKPKCPKCGKEIEGLMGNYPAVVGGYASILDGELNLQLNESYHLWELVDEDSVIWSCPECDAELFKAGQEAEMTAFLKRESGVGGY